MIIICKQAVQTEVPNTTLGNKGGGLSNIVEKALGSKKSGSSLIVDVVGSGEKNKKRLILCKYTRQRFCVRHFLQLAAGMNMHILLLTAAQSLWFEYGACN